MRKNKQKLTALSLVTMLFFAITPLHSFANHNDGSSNLWWGVSSSTERKINDLDNESEDDIVVPILLGVMVEDLDDTWGDARASGRTHEGTDIFAPRGAFIVSPTDAVVTRIDYGDTGGKVVYTANPGGELFYYAHLEDYADGLNEGDELKKGDLIVCEAGDQIPGDGEVIEGIASVDEAAITGESAPVIRESGGDRSAVTGGTRVLSDRIVIRITAEPGSSFLDRMIALVEGAKRQKTPNEIALTILLSGLTIIFLLAMVSLKAFAVYSESAAGFTGVTTATVPVLIALLVCLIPTTIGGLLSAIGISGMDRMIQRNVLATSGRAIEAAGDIDVLLLDKTGTITLGNRMATNFVSADGVAQERLADAAQLSSLADETPEGRSIVVLAKEQFNLRGRELADAQISFVPFTAQTRMSGADFPAHNGDAAYSIRKGAADAIKGYVQSNGGIYPADVQQKVRTRLQEETH